MDEKHQATIGIEIKAIGVIRTPFQQPAGTPIQPSRSDGARGTVEIFDEFREGLKDLDGFDRIWLLYWLDRAPSPRFRVRPFLDDCPRGLFATRAPSRPNPIGMSPVRLLRINGSVLEVADVDVLDGTPLLDIKPYVPDFDCYPVERAGWYDRVRSSRRMADGRFDASEARTE